MTRRGRAELECAICGRRLGVRFLRVKAKIGTQQEPICSNCRLKRGLVSGIALRVFFRKMGEYYAAEKRQNFAARPISDNHGVSLKGFK